MFTRTLISVSTRPVVIKACAQSKPLPAVTISSVRSFFKRMGGSQSVDTNTQSSEFVKQEIDNNCVVVFSKTTCGFCRMAKQVLDSTGVEYKAIEINKMAEGPDIQKALHSITGQSTVPCVFVNRKCIGGGTETKALHQQGKLLPLIQQCGVSSNLWWLLCHFTCFYWQHMTCNLSMWNLQKCFGMWIVDFVYLCFCSYSILG